VERELEALQRDLARFERRTRLMWLAGLAAAVVVAVLWGGVQQAQSQSASMTARQLVLVDQSTRPRIVLASDTSDRPGIWMRDDAGKDRLFLGFGAQKGTPQFTLSDETGRTRANAGFSLERGDSQVTLADPTGTTRVYFGFGVQLRTPQMVLNDERGKDRIYAGWTQSNTAIVDVIDDAGNVVWKTGAAATPGGGSTGGGSTGGGTPGSTHKSGAP